MKNTQTNGNEAINPHVSAAMFELDGTNDPTVFSINVESVTRLTSIAGSEPFYRVRLTDTRAFGAGRNPITMLASISQLIGDDLDVAVVLDAEPTGDPAEVEREIDVRVRSAGLPTNSLAGPRRVFLRFMVDLASV